MDGRLRQGGHSIEGESIGNEQVDYRVLGSVEVLAGGETLRLDAPRHQPILSVLALRPGEVVPTGTTSPGCA